MLLIIRVLLCPAVYLSAGFSSELALAFIFRLKKFPCILAAAAFTSGSSRSISEMLKKVIVVASDEVAPP